MSKPQPKKDRVPIGNGPCSELSTESLISPERLAEFKQIYLEEFSEELSDEEALEKSIDLLNLFKAIYRPIPVDKAAIYNSMRGCYNEDVPQK